MPRPISYTRFLANMLVKFEITAVQLFGDKYRSLVAHFEDSAFQYVLLLLSMRWGQSDRHEKKQKTQQCQQHIVFFICVR